jgi:hypothetical protein
MHHFTKTGSGQTSAKHAKKRCVFFFQPEPEEVSAKRKGLFGDCRRRKSEPSKTE